jgi:hypothetical protein
MRRHSGRRESQFPAGPQFQLVWQIVTKLVAPAQIVYFTHYFLGIRGIRPKTELVVEAPHQFGRLIHLILDEQRQCLPLGNLQPLTDHAVLRWGAGGD